MPQIEQRAVVLIWPPTSARHPPIPSNMLIMWIAPGPMTTMNRAGRMQSMQREEDLDRDLLRLLLRLLTPDDAHRRGLLAQHPGDRETESVGLHEGA